MMHDNVVSRDWMDAPPRFSQFTPSGDRLMRVASSGTGTVAVRYHGCNGPIIMVDSEIDFPHSDAHQIIQASRSVLFAIFKYFDFAHDVELGFWGNRTSEHPSATIRNAINSFNEIGAELPDRLYRAQNCPAKFQDQGYPLLAFYDRRKDVKYRYAFLIPSIKMNKYPLPKNLVGSYQYADNFITFEKSEDAMVVKLKCDTECIVLDLHGHIVAAPEIPND